MKEINVLSCFDGMSCGQIALEQLGMAVGSYYASEIDKFAVKTSSHNFPDTIHLGDITKVKYTKKGFVVDGKLIPCKRIDLILAGSPCQGFSMAGKGLNFNDPRSVLFFDFLRLLAEIRAVNPEVKFLLENVRMKYEHEIRISRFLDINPIIINSALVSAQNRERLYWTNIAVEPQGLFGDLHSTIQQPEDKGILLKHILESDVADKYYLSDIALSRIKRRTHFKAQVDPDKTGTINTKNNSGQLGVDNGTTLVSGVVFDRKGIREIGDKSLNIDANYYKGHDYHGACTMIETKVYNGAPRSGDNKKGGTGLLTRKDGKIFCIDTNTNTIEIIKKIDIGGNLKTNQDKASTFTAGAHSGGNHSDMDLIHIRDVKPQRLYDIDGGSQGNRLYSPETKAITQSAVGGGRGAKGGLYEVRERIRRLTPLEVCRLQNVPDSYFWDKDGKQIVSDSQIYKMCGNGWTIHVITHILSYY